MYKMMLGSIMLAMVALAREVFAGGPAFQLSPVVIAHRGVPAYLPEHTLEGAAMAYAFAPHYIELDLVMTKDDRLIVHHDLTLESTTDVEKVFPKRQRKDGKWYAIDFTLNEIKKLAVHERTSKDKAEPAFLGRFPFQKSSFEVPTFEEMIELVQGLNTSSGRTAIGIYPEVKDYDFHLNESRDPLKPMVEILKRFLYVEKNSGAVIQSFDAAALKKLRHEYKIQLPLVQLIGGQRHAAFKTAKGIAEIATYADGIGPSIRDLFLPNSLSPSSLIADAKVKKLVVHAYTLRADDKLPPGVTFEMIAAKLIACGVDGIFTDNADRLVKALEKRSDVACK